MMLRTRPGQAGFGLRGKLGQKMAILPFDADPATLGGSFFGANLLAGLSGLVAVAIARPGTGPLASTGGGTTGAALP